MDFGGTSVTGIHVSVIAALRDYFGLEPRPVRVLEMMQMLGFVEEDLKTAMGIDTEGVYRSTTKFGDRLENWKPWRMPDGLEILAPGTLATSIDANGDILIHPQGDPAAPPSARMPRDGYFFDCIIRQPEIDEGRLDPRDNLEEFTPLPDSEIDYIAGAARAARATGRYVIGGFGGLSLGDIANVPAPGLKFPKGIRDITEWYVSTRSRRGYVHKVFEGQTAAGIRNLERIHAAVGDNLDAVYICGTDFGTQTSSFCSVATFNELWAPYYKAICDWVHKNTSWKTFKHSCGAVSKFYPSFIECGFDIVNPVQCSAAGMDPGTLKAEFGGQLVFWGGGVDTQQVLPFGTPEEVRRQVLERLDIFSRGGGYVFNTVHNIQARTPVENVVAMLDAVREFNQG